MSTLRLAERIIALNDALHDVPHAFGGALALAYYAEPRATIDIDLNLFVTADRFPQVATRLGDLGVAVDDPALAELVLRDGQARVIWDETPIDLFFAYDAFHDAAAGSVEVVPFGESTITILGASHLVVCKAVYNRPKDWVDIDAVLAAGSPVDAAEVLRWVGRIAGDRDPRFERVVAHLAG